MGNWNYVRTERARATNGDYRLEIVSAEEKESSTGFPMIVLGVKPNGYDMVIQKRISQKNMKYFNEQLTSIYDSFNIEEGNFNFPTWIGAVGAGRLKENENGFMEVYYFIDKKRAEKLPPWQGDMPERQTVTDLGGGMAEIDDPELPFF